MSFYNINNELVSQESILEDLISYYNELHDAGKTKVTDFNEGSEVRTLLEVLSHLGYNLLEEANNTLRNHFINTAEGEYLDLIGTNPNVNLPREQGSEATGLVKFTLETAPVEEVIIEAGTLCSNGDMTYETDEDAVFGIGESSTYCSVTCTLEGADGNTLAGTITEVDWSGDYPVTVTNVDDFTDGADFEEDDVYRERLLEFVRMDNFGSRGYYENLLLNVDNVHDIKEAGTPSATVDYLLNTNQGASVDSVAVNDALTLLLDNSNVVLGHTFNIGACTSVPVTVTLTVNADCGVSDEEWEDIVKTYFKGGECSTYPFTFNGFSMGDTADASVVAGELSGLMDSISSLTVTLSDNSTLGDYEAYYVSDVVVAYVE